MCWLKKLEEYAAVKPAKPCHAQEATPSLPSFVLAPARIMAARGCQTSCVHEGEAAAVPQQKGDAAPHKKLRARVLTTTAGDFWAISTSKVSLPTARCKLLKQRVRQQ